MSPVLYMVPTSPAVRAVQITAKALALDLVLKEVDMGAGEHLKAEFLKINPQHTIPTLVDDDGFVIWDSHVIITYLVSKYGKDDGLYPKDIRKRAIIDQRLFFELWVVFSRLHNVANPIICDQKKQLTQDDLNSINEIYQFLEAFLEGRKWIADDAVTVADYSLMSSVSSFNVLVSIDEKKYPKVFKWFKLCEELPEYEANRKGLAIFSECVKKSYLK